MSANSDKYRRAMTGFSAVVDKVSAGEWAGASPCDGWTAKHVVGHVISGTDMITVARTGKPAVFDDPIGVAGDDPTATFAAARDLALSTLTDEFLTKDVPSPMGDLPLDQILGMFLTNDVLIHTWDLAQATGIPIELDGQLVDEAYNGLLPIDAMIRQPGLFGPKVEPPDGADPTTRLMCFVGRQAG
jgi:uncharacterized protein (TIGR03086 family)